MDMDMDMDMDMENEADKYPDYIKDLYNNFIQSSAILHNIKIESLLKTMLINKKYEYDSNLPITPANELDIGSIMMGMDNNAYIIKVNRDGNYWYKLKRL
jgi:hypothetical protein